MNQSIWEGYPAHYRDQEVQHLLLAVRAGECAAVVGLSGAGKSNLLGFMAARKSDCPALVLVDCNRLAQLTLDDFFSLIRRTLGETEKAGDEYTALEAALRQRLATTSTGLCILFDRFDAIQTALAPAVSGSLRALRDNHKYRLTYITAARRPPEPSSELAELFYAHTLWLGPLAENDARWSILSYMKRAGLELDETAMNKLVEFSRGYPALLRACCQAYAAGCVLKLQALRTHPAVQRRVKEFWADAPSATDLINSGLENHPLLVQSVPANSGAPALTAKEALLLEYLQARPGEVCEKDDIIRAVWPEDKAFIEGIRDDSLAQLVRRLRRKIEPDPQNPHHILNVIGRGYRYMP